MGASCYDKRKKEFLRTVGTKRPALRDIGGGTMAANPIIPANDSRLLGPADCTLIDVDAPAEMRHWVRELGRPAAQLKAAVQVVGPLVSDVRAYLQRRALYGPAR